MNMNNLNQLNDAELSAVFAVEVAEYTKKYLLIKRGYYFRPEAKGYVYAEAEAGRFTEAEAREYVDPSHGEVTICADKPPSFATSMDAVLPYFAARDEYCEIRYGHGLWVCFIGPNEMGVSSYDPSPKALKTTLPRAACIALILAARAEKEAAK